MLTPALSRNWQVVIPREGCRYGTAVDPWLGLLQMERSNALSRRAACGVNKEPAEQSAGACLKERFVEETPER